MPSQSAVRPTLVLISDEEHHPGQQEVIEQMCRAAKPGSVAVLLRDRQLPVRQRWRLGHRLRVAAADGGQVLVVAERIDLGLALEAQGIHLPVGGCLPSQVLELGRFTWLSRAHHDLETLDASEVQRLTHALVSPAVAPRKGRPPLGAAGLTARSAQLRQMHPGLLVCALGGLGAEHAAFLKQPGIDALCIQGGIYRRGAPEEVLLALGIARS